MSRQHLDIGTLKPIKIENGSWEETAKSILDKEPREIYNEHTDLNLNKLLYSEAEDKSEYIFFDDQLYKVEYTDSRDRECLMIEDKDGTIHFVANFYDGGACLTEILLEQLERDAKDTQEQDNESPTA